jgi:hypothetical protein
LSRPPPTAMPFVLPFDFALVGSSKASSGLGIEGEPTLYELENCAVCAWAEPLPLPLPLLCWAGEELGFPTRGLESFWAGRLGFSDEGWLPIGDGWSSSSGACASVKQSSAWCSKAKKLHSCLSHKLAKLLLLSLDQ